MIIISRQNQMPTKHVFDEPNGLNTSKFYWWIKCQPTLQRMLHNHPLKEGFIHRKPTALCTDGQNLSVHKEVENEIISYYWNIHHNQSREKVKQTQVAWLAFMFIQNLAQNFPKLCACNVKGQKSIIEAKLNQTSVLRLKRWNLVAPFTSYFQQTFENKHNIQQG